MTESRTLTLSEFLLARIAEDKAEIAAGSHFAELGSSGWIGHAATWGRARALAECEGKRQIVALHGGKDSGFMPLERKVSKEEALTLWKARTPTLTCGVCLFEHGYPCKTLRALALPYVDHADYREEWKP